MTPTHAEIARLQSYLRENARIQYDAVALPPFTLFIKPTDPLSYFNYAIPDGPVSGDLTGELSALRAEFHARGRVARFEFFEAFAPDLPAALRACGFVEEARQWSMTCTPGGLRRPPEAPGLVVTAIDARSTDEDLGDFLAVQRQGFDPENTSPVTTEEITRARDSFSRSGAGAFLGRMDGAPAGASYYSRPFDGISELAGIATREAFRKRGIASLLTWYAAQAVFEAGVEVAFLTAEDARAGRVYERVGFQPFSTMLAYLDPAEESAH